VCCAGILYTLGCNRFSNQKRVILTQKRLGAAFVSATPQEVAGHRHTPSFTVHCATDLVLGECATPLAKLCGTAEPLRNPVLP
jgi:hypothetical protein